MGFNAAHSLCEFLLAAGLLCAGQVSSSQVETQPLTDLKKSATIQLGGSPDWMVITKDAVWVSNDQLKAVQRIDPKTNRVVAKIDFSSHPCSGLAYGFGSVWVPLCGEPAGLARIDPASNKVIATLPLPPANDEGGITVSDSGVWLVTDERGTLVWIDPATTTIKKEIKVPEKSANPLFSDGMVWVTSPQTNTLRVVDASKGIIIATVPTGPTPRFLTAGAGSIWVLNQGDGSVTRVDAKTKKVIATIQANIPGKGGEICYGAGSVWATLLKTPLTQVDPKSNRVLHQWIGPGGDSVRYGHGSIWLTDLRGGLLWRIPYIEH